MMDIIVQSEKQTIELGHWLGQNIQPGLTLALNGTLGAGKTFLVQSIGEGLGVARDKIVSPTFAMIQIYQGRVPLVHIDAYRIADEDEFFELGIEEYFSDPTCVVAMEWADRFTERLPESYVSIDIQLENDQRLLRFRPIGHSESVMKLTKALETREGFVG